MPPIRTGVWQVVDLRNTTYINTLNRGRQEIIGACVPAGNSAVRMRLWAQMLFKPPRSCLAMRVERWARAKTTCAECKPPRRRKQRERILANWRLTSRAHRRHGHRPRLQWIGFGAFPVGQQPLTPEANRVSPRRG